MIEIVKNKINEYQRPKRIAFSSKYPHFKEPIVFVRRTLRNIKNYITLGARLEKKPFLTHVIARHSSLLYRKLGETDPKLQISKVHNLRLAINKLNGIVISPGGTFSFWHQVGMTNKANGYVEGLILSNGVPATGIGGGLCQLSNFLFWIFLHTDIEIIERYHHSVDAFPDSGRTLPFGSGATILCNYVDLKIKNISKNPLQIKLWLTDSCLKGQILSDEPSESKFHLKERNHYFVENHKRYFRFNEIYRETHIEGVKVKEEKIATNFAPVIYSITEDYLVNNRFELIRV